MLKSLLSVIGVTSAAHEKDEAAELSPPLANARVELHSVFGVETTLLLRNATIHFDAKSVSFYGEPEDPEDASIYEFNYATISRFRQHDQDMFQWSISKKGNGEDVADGYGLMFLEGDVVNLFHHSMIAFMFSESCQILVKYPCDFKSYNRPTRCWQSYGENESESSETSKIPPFTVSIVQRTHAMEYFLVIHHFVPTEQELQTDSSTRDTAQNEDAAEIFSRSPVCYIAISQDEYVFPLPSEGKIQWWGAVTSNGEGVFERKLYAVDLAEKNDIEAFKQYSKKDVFDAYTKVVDTLSRKHLSGNEDFSSDAFDMDIDQEDDSRYDFDDAYSRESSLEDDKFSIVDKDPTTDLLKTTPDRPLNRLLEISSRRGYIFRSPGPGSTVLNDLQVLGFDDQGIHNVVATIDGSKMDYKGTHINPSGTLLHDHENKFVLLDEKRPTEAYLMDIEKEEIINKWDMDGNHIKSLIPNTADASKTGDPTFLAINPQSVFRVDTRIKDACARKETLNYASKVQFTCGATTKNGELLLGSNGGDMRLYDGKCGQDPNKLKRAKTHIPGKGDPVHHVDVLSDGSWILGACSKYLILYPVKMSESGKTGFMSPFGSVKPNPIILKLKLEDIAKYNMQNFEFHKAEFDAEERNIITTTNNLVILWDFLAVKKGSLDAYQIRKIPDYIKDTKCIKTLTGERLLLATPCDVTTKCVRNFKV